MESNEGISHQEGRDERRARWAEEHRRFVESGGFDAIPKTEITVGEVVAVRGSSLIHQVYELSDNTVLVGYDAGGKQVRENIPRNDVRSASGYQNALLAFKGLGRFEVKVEEGETFIRHNPLENN